MISVAVYNHYKRVATGTMDEIEIEKSNMLMIGPTGCGKDKSMFMVNAIGTAVIVDFKAKNETVFSNNNIISKDILENAIICHKIKKEILNGNNPSKDQYAVIVGNKDIAEPLIKLYLEKEKNTGLPVNTDETISFIKTLEQDFASDLMYNLLYSDAYKQETILSIINQCNLFDPQKTMKILSDFLHIA